MHNNENRFLIEEFLYCYIKIEQIFRIIDNSSYNFNL